MIVAVIIILLVVITTVVILNFISLEGVKNMVSEKMKVTIREAE